ncbi:HNH endonuclease signature motif containing protein [Methylobacterium sp. SI9]|uniref:HNH endonuclease signature motif containing protein n=1 Tax=Methylobacterium guangdongense TaxID=3138811 RepID=UPI00313D1047
MTREPIPLPPADELRRILSYHPRTGRLTWRVKVANRVQIGDAADNGHEGDYRNVTIKGRSYRAHRIIWKMVTGEEPIGEIDHRDLVRSNNRWLNLRAASHSDNACNKSLYRNNTTGLTGVHPHGSSYHAQIKRHGRQIHLGAFRTIEAAHAAYLAAARELHGSFNRSLRERA